MLFNGLSQSEKVILFKYIKTIFRLYIDRLCDHLIFQLNTVILSAGVDNTAVFTSAELQYIGTFTNDTANRITAMDTNIANITQDLAAADANYQAALDGTDDNLKAETPLSTAIDSLQNVHILSLLIHAYSNKFGIRRCIFLKI